LRFNIREEIKLQKEYNTKFKEEMMLYLKKNRDRRVSAYQIYEYMQENNIKINLTTIYRNLDRLTNAGKLLKVKHAVYINIWMETKSAKGICIYSVKIVAV